MKKFPKRLTLIRETLRSLDHDLRMDKVMGGAWTQITACFTCTTECSLCPN